MERRLRFADLQAANIVKNRVTLKNWIEQLGFPPGQLTGPNTRTWGESEIQQWVDNRPTAPKPTPVRKSSAVAVRAKRMHMKAEMVPRPAPASTGSEPPETNAVGERQWSSSKPPIPR